MKSLLVSLLLLVVLSGQAHAQAIRQFCATSSTGDVSVTTTAETVTVTSPNCSWTGAPFKATVHCYWNMTTSLNSTTYKVRVRRATLTGTALGDAIAQTVKVAAGGKEEVNFLVVDENTASLNNVVYVCTVEMAGADGTTTVNEAAITVAIQ